MLHGEKGRGNYFLMDRVLDVKKVLEMSNSDGCMTMLMYLLQLNIHLKMVNVGNCKCKFYGKKPKTFTETSLINTQLIH